MRCPIRRRAATAAGAKLFNNDVTTLTRFEYLVGIFFFFYAAEDTRTMRSTRTQKKRCKICRPRCVRTTVFPIDKKKGNVFLLDGPFHVGVVMSLTNRRSSVAIKSYAAGANEEEEEEEANEKKKPKTMKSQKIKQNKEKKRTERRRIDGASAPRCKKKALQTLQRERERERERNVEINYGVLSWKRRGPRRR